MDDSDIFDLSGAKFILLSEDRIGFPHMLDCGSVDILVIGILGIMAHSVRVDKPELNWIVANLVILRAYLPLFDIEERKHSNNDFSNVIFFILSANGLLT